MTMSCSNCGHEIVEGAEFCGNCGARIMQAPQQPSSQTINSETVVAAPSSPRTTAVVTGTEGAISIETPQDVQQRPVAYAIQSKPNPTLSRLGLIFGILSILTMLLFPFGQILSIVAIVLSVIGLQKGGKGFAISGIVTGVLTIVLSIGLIAVVLVYCSDNKSDESCKQLNERRSIVVPIQKIIGG